MDVEQTLAAIVDAANRAPRVHDFLRGWDRVIRLKVDDQLYVLATAAQSVSLDKGPAEQTDLGFELDAGTLSRLLLGQTTPLSAKIGGKIKTTGNLTDILRFASILSEAIRTHSAAPTMSTCAVTADNRPKP